MYSVCLFLVLAQPAGYQWVNYPDGDKARIALYQNGRQVGSYNYEKDLYFPLIPATGDFGPACPCPVEVPNRRNFGLQTSAISVTQRFSTNGGYTDADSARLLLDGDHNKIPSSNAKFRMVIVGKSEKTGPATEAIKKLLREEELQTTIVQAYDPEHWIVKQEGLNVSAELTLYFLEPDGKELLRWESFDDGAGAWVEACRIRRPDYSPNSDPFSGKSLLALVQRYSSYALASLLAGASLILFLRRR